MTIIHRHHIIPKHAGGTDDPENIIELTIEDHADAHRQLYEMYGRWQDRVAWLSLSGMMGEEERLYEIFSNSNKGNPTNYKHSPEMIKHLSESKKGDKNPMYGKPAPNRGQKRPGVGGRKRGTKWSDAERRKHEEIRSRPGYYDYNKNPDRCRKISESKKGCVGSATGKKWFNNGERETYAYECPIGYRLGRKPRATNGKKGMRWYNNGIENRQFYEGAEPEGFCSGRLKK